MSRPDWLRSDESLRRERDEALRASDVERDRRIASNWEEVHAGKFTPRQAGAMNLELIHVHLAENLDIIEDCFERQTRRNNIRLGIHLTLIVAAYVAVMWFLNG